MADKKNKSGLSPFDPLAVSEETLALNEAVAKSMLKEQDRWEYSPQEMRKRRNEGVGAFAAPKKSERARDEMIGGLAVRIIEPSEKPKGVYLHFHGGGFVLNHAWSMDRELERIARVCGLVTVSVEYRLAPEHPFPAAVEDAYRAAQWLAEKGGERFGSERFFIGGESAGANLALVALIENPALFKGATLVSGVYDMTTTPSALERGADSLVINHEDMKNIYKCYVPSGVNPRDPRLSPLYARLKGLPPVLLTVGTLDPFLDDTLFLHARLGAVNSRSELAVYAGGIHCFTSFLCPLAEEANQAIYRFLKNGAAGEN